MPNLGQSLSNLVLVMVIVVDGLFGFLAFLFHFSLVCISLHLTQLQIRPEKQGACVSLSEEMRYLNREA